MLAIASPIFSFLFWSRDLGEDNVCFQLVLKHSRVDGRQKMLLNKCSHQTFTSSHSKNRRPVISQCYSVRAAMHVEERTFYLVVFSNRKLIL